MVSSEKRFCVVMLSAFASEFRTAHYKTTLQTILCVLDGLA